MTIAERHAHQNADDPAPASILSKAFDILAAFSPDRRVLTLTQISQATGLPKSTVHRLLSKLIPLGVIEPHGIGFKVGLPLRRLTSVMPIEGLRQSALPHLARLHHWSGRHVHLAGALRAGDVTFVERILVPGSDLPSADPGTVFPAHATAMGKAMLAFATDEELETVLARPLISITPETVTDPSDLRRQLKQIRATRVAYSRGESHPDIMCVSSPIVMRGRAVAALSISGHRTEDRIDRAVVDAVTLTAERVSRTTLQNVIGPHEDWFPGFD